jgi:radical SAM protein with 4Fe4S-binding SPASM domain
MHMPVTHDILNMLSKLTFGRIWNLVRLVSGYGLSVVLRKPLQWGMPYSISIEPTTACNLQCPECPAGLRQFTRDTGSMDPGLFNSITDQLAGDLMYMLLYFQGEPFLNRHFFEFVRYARGKGIYTAASTNAHFLDPQKAEETVRSGLDRLIISLDGIGQEAYAAYRTGGSFNMVLEGIGNLVKSRRDLGSKTPYIILQFIVFRSNEHQVDEVRKLGKRLGVDTVQIKSAQIYGFESGSPLIPSVERYSRYRKMPDGRYAIKSSLKNRCFRMWTGCVITWDGLVVPCCYDKDAAFRLGDLKQTAFRDIWHGVSYRDFRLKMLKNRKMIDMCRNCTQGLRM